jgi:hypothetical protein
LLPIIEDMRAYGEHWLGLDCVGAAKAALGKIAIAAA